MNYLHQLHELAGLLGTSGNLQLINSINNLILHHQLGTQDLDIQYYRDYYRSLTFQADRDEPNYIFQLKKAPLLYLMQLNSPAPEVNELIDLLVLKFQHHYRLNFKNVVELSAAMEPTFDKFLASNIAHRFNRFRLDFNHGQLQLDNVELLLLSSNKLAICLVDDDNDELVLVFPLVKPGLLQDARAQANSIILTVNSVQLVLTCGAPETAAQVLQLLGDEHLVQLDESRFTSSFNKLNQLRKSSVGLDLRVKNLRRSNNLLAKHDSLNTLSSVAAGAGPDAHSLNTLSSVAAGAGPDAHTKPYLDFSNYLNDEKYLNKINLETNIHLNYDPASPTFKLKSVDQLSQKECASVHSGVHYEAIHEVEPEVPEGRDQDTQKDEAPIRHINLSDTRPTYLKKQRSLFDIFKKSKKQQQEFEIVKKSSSQKSIATLSSVGSGSSDLATRKDQIISNSNSIDSFSSVDEAATEQDCDYKTVQNVKVLKWDINRWNELQLNDTIKIKDNLIMLGDDRVLVSKSTKFKKNGLDLQINRAFLLRFKSQNDFKQFYQVLFGLH